MGLNKHQDIVKKGSKSKRKIKLAAENQDNKKYKTKVKCYFQTCKLETEEQLTSVLNKIITLLIDLSL